MPLFLFPAIRSGDYYLFDESEDEAEIEAGIDTIKFGMGEEEEKHGISPIEVGVSIVSGDYRSVPLARTDWGPQISFAIYAGRPLTS